MEQSYLGISSMFRAQKNFARFRKGQKWLKISISLLFMAEAKSIRNSSVKRKKTNWSVQVICALTVEDNKSKRALNNIISFPFSTPSQQRRDRAKYRLVDIKRVVLVKTPLIIYNITIVCANLNWSNAPFSILRYIKRNFFYRIGSRESILNVILG